MAPNDISHLQYDVEMPVVYYILPTAEEEVMQGLCKDGERGQYEGTWG